MKPEADTIPMYDTRPFVFVLFGATGDLATRRIFPALFDLYSRGDFPRKFRIVGIAEDEMLPAAFRARIGRALREYSSARPKEIDAFCEALDYNAGNIALPHVYARLRDSLDSVSNMLFYLACPPELFETAARNIAEHGLAGKSQSGSGFRRIIVEKPYGTNLARARNLNKLLHTYYREEDIYRIDHYLGKDAVQNMMYFRFSNTVFEPMWNRNYIDRVEIVVDEEEGVGKRGAYYDSVGASRDMLQNHLLQLACLTAMEPPEDLSAEKIHDAKLEVLRAMEIPSHSALSPSCIRGQYVRGAETRAVSESYKKEYAVHRESFTETFIAVKVLINNMRWKGVPFILKTGKALNRRCAEIILHFRHCPIDIPGASPKANKLILRIQPDEGIRLRFNTWNESDYILGQDELVSTMRGSSDTASGPYERLLYNALTGDSSLFIRFDETEEAWRVMEPVLTLISEEKHENLVYYNAGSEGPDTAILLQEQSGTLYRKHIGS